MKERKGLTTSKRYMKQRDKKRIANKKWKDKGIRIDSDAEQGERDARAEMGAPLNTSD